MKKKFRFFILLLSSLLQTYAMDIPQNPDAEVIFRIKLTERNPECRVPINHRLFNYYMNGNNTDPDPEGIGKRKGLTYVLLLHGYDLVSLPAEISGLVKLTEIHLLNNRLATIPLEIGKLAHLTKLCLSVNELIILPSQIGNLSSLTHLNLSHNKLTHIPVEIGNLARLTQLDLACNELVHLPSEIGNLHAIKSICFYDNNLMSIPIEIGRLKTLECLSLSSNNLINLPDQIGKLLNLSYLGIHSNPIRNLPSKTFYMARLTKIYLPDNFPFSTNKKWSNPLKDNELKLFKSYNRTLFVLMLPYLYDSNCIFAILPRDVINLVCLMHIGSLLEAV